MLEPLRGVREGENGLLKATARGPTKKPAKYRCVGRIAFQEKSEKIWKKIKWTKLSLCRTNRRPGSEKSKYEQKSIKKKKKK